MQEPKQKQRRGGHRQPVLAELQGGQVREERQPAGERPVVPGLLLLLPLPD